MTLKLIIVLAMFFISSDGRVEKSSPEQDVKTGEAEAEKCEYPQSCSNCFEDIENVIFAGKYIYIILILHF